MRKQTQLGEGTLLLLLLLKLLLLMNIGLIEYVPGHLDNDDSTTINEQWTIY
jgi:hypothetical protein